MMSDVSKENLTQSTLEDAVSAPLATGRKSLKEAMRQVRQSSAERSDVIVDLREAEITRLELLLDDMAGLIEDLPENDDQFEITLVPSHPPRLWIDMLAYVVMGRDKHSYQLVKDTRNGREILAETPDRADMVDAVVDYVAYRLLEREKAFAADKMPTPVFAVRPKQEDAAEAAKPAEPHKSQEAPQAEAPATAPVPVVRQGFGVSALILSYLFGVFSTLGGLGAVAYFLFAK